MAVSGRRDSGIRRARQQASVGVRAAVASALAAVAHAHPPCREGVNDSIRERSGARTREGDLVALAIEEAREERLLVADERRDPLLDARLRDEAVGLDRVRLACADGPWPIRCSRTSGLFGSSRFSPTPPGVAREEEAGPRVVVEIEQVLGAPLLSAPPSMGIGPLASSSNESDDQEPYPPGRGQPPASMPQQPNPASLPGVRQHTWSGVQQLAPQQLRPAPHEAPASARKHGALVQLPFWQIDPPSQTTPQLPQFAASVPRKEQCGPPQQASLQAGQTQFC